MTDGQRTAIDAVVAVLERENAVLRAGQHAGLGALAGEKQAALSRLDAEMPVAPDATPELLGRALVLRDTVAENRRLLKQGMAVQQRIMALLAGAARRAAEGNGYGAGGAPNRTAAPVPVALSARA